MTEDTSKSSNVLIDSSEVASLMGVKRRRLFLFFKSELAATFPKPVSLGKRVNRWVRGEVEHWIVNDMPRHTNQEDLRDTSEEDHH